MEAIRSSETSVNARSTQRHIPEDDILQCYDLQTCDKTREYMELFACSSGTDVTSVFHASFTLCILLSNKVAYLCIGIREAVVLLPLLRRLR
jgi:hypothetical protein